MPGWAIRGLVLAVVHAAGAVVVAKLTVFYPADTTVPIWITFAVLLGVSLAWGSVDGWLRKPDPWKTWLIAALLAGPVAGILQVLGRALFVDQSGATELGVQLTSGAAFTALLVLVPAVVGLLVGSLLEPPTPATAPPAPDADDDDPAAAARRRIAERKARRRKAEPREAKPRPSGKPAAERPKVTE